MTGTPECNSGDKCSGKLFENVLWWTMLMVGVIAIPSAAIIITLMLPLSDTMRVFSFVLACWGCTWVGMWLMNKAKAKQ